MSIIKYLKQMLNGIVWAAASVVILATIFDGIGLLINGFPVIVLVSFMAGAFGYYLAGGEKNV